MIDRITQMPRRWWSTSSKGNRAIGIALVVVTVILFSIAGSAASTQEDLDASEEALAGAQAEVDDLQGHVNDLEDRVDEVESSAADDLEAAEADADDRVAAVRDELRDRRAALDDREAGLDQREADLTAFETFVENNSFSDGTYLVNQDISPGRYRNDGGGSCYWERLGGLSGDFNDLLANDLPSGPTVVDILPSDVAFSTTDCGTWTKIG